MLRQIDSSFPSISAIKKLHLVGYTPPTQVHYFVHIIIMCISCEIIYCVNQHFSQEGIPFYINSATNIVRRCIGNPQIASRIATYPTIPKNTVRYVCDKE